MNRHLAIKMSCFCVLELRNSPAHFLLIMARIPRLESENFNHNLFDPDLIRASLRGFATAPLTIRDMECKPSPETLVHAAYDLKQRFAFHVSNR